MYRLRVFGGLGLEHDGAAVDDVVSHRKALALLAVLAVQGPTSRDVLLALLWPESDTSRARGSLKQVVHFLRNRLAAPDLLLGKDELRLNPAVISTDIGAFVEARAQNDLRAAAAQYGGRFLEGFHAGNAAEFDRWADLRADELARQYADVLEKVARAAELEGDWSGAASWWRRLQVLEPINSPATLGLMRALEASGQVAAALHAALAHEQLLREEWGLQPDAAVNAFAEELRSSSRLAAEETGLAPIAPPAIAAERVDSASLSQVSIRPRSVARVVTLLSLAMLLSVAVGAWLWIRDTRAESQAPLRIVVLPFDERSESREAHYLTVGLGDALSTELSRFHAVIAPTYNSTIHYEGSTLPRSQIGREMSADALLSGSVHQVGDRLRVEVELFDVRTNQSIWTHEYDRPAADVLDIQRRILQAITATLGIDLNEAERALLVREPTRDSRAWDLYLRGRELELRPLQSDLMSAEHIRDAQSLYSRARDLDRNFAMARSRLAVMHIYSAMTYDPTPARYEQARLEAESALRIQPGLAEAHEALAAYWGGGHKDYRKSVEQLKLTLAGWPNSADQHMNLAASYRTLGQWEQAVSALERAMQLEPRSLSTANTATLTYTRLRRYAESVKAWDLVIALDPDNPMAEIGRGYVFLNWQGSADTLAAVLRRIPAEWDPDGLGTFARYTVARIEGRNSDALALLDASSQSIVFDRSMYRPFALLRAQTYEDLGQHGHARSNYEAARTVLVDSIAAYPEAHLDWAHSTPVPRMRIALGLAYAGLGRKQEAVREARRAMELVPLSGNTIAATAAMAGAVEIFARAGDVNAAFGILELLLGIPAGREVSVPLLRVDPAYDPLRKDPRFTQLLERFSVN